MELSCEYSSIFCGHIVCVVDLVWVEEFEAGDVLFVGRVVQVCGVVLKISDIGPS
jgi:hypothetical protein